jgi:hypothetical protein
MLIGGAGNDSVFGRRGIDTALLGAGDDSFQWDPGDANDVIDGNAGTDTLMFNGANINEVMSLSANGSHSVFLRNIANIRMDMNNVEQLNLAALGGTDDITINDMSGTGFRQANIDLSSAGASDGVLDTVTVNGTDKADRVNVSADNGGVDTTGLRTSTRITGADTRDQLHVSTFGGNDSVTVDRGATALIGVAVDLGSGQR